MHISRLWNGFSKKEKAMLVFLIISPIKANPELIILTRHMVADLLFFHKLHKKYKKGGQ